MTGQHDCNGNGKGNGVMLMDIGSSIAELPQNLAHQIEEYENIFTVDTVTLKKVVDHFVKELEKGAFTLHSISTASIMY